MKPHNRIYVLLISIIAVGLTAFVLVGQPFSDEIWWVLAIILYGFGDSLTTVIAVQKENIKEAIPATRYIFGDEPSLWSMLMFKAVLFAGVMIVYYLFLMDNHFRKIAPVGIAIAGTFAVVWNSYASYSSKH